MGEGGQGLTDNVYDPVRVRQTVKPASPPGVKGWSGMPPLGGGGASCH